MHECVIVNRLIVSRARCVRPHPRHSPRFVARYAIDEHIGVPHSCCYRFSGVILIDLFLCVINCVILALNPLSQALFRLCAVVCEIGNQAILCSACVAFYYRIIRWLLAVNPLVINVSRASRVSVFPHWACTSLCHAFYCVHKRPIQQCSL